MTVSIRPAKEEDMDSVLLLIKELAEYENAPNEVIITAEQLKKDGFGKDKVFDCFIAVNKDKSVIGMALFYTGYSTWKGKKL